MLGYLNHHLLLLCVWRRSLQSDGGVADINGELHTPTLVLMQLELVGPIKGLLAQDARVWPKRRDN